MLHVGNIGFYMHNNKVYSAAILSIMRVENFREEFAHTEEQKEMWTRFGPQGTFYATAHGVFSAEKVFPSKRELLESL